MRSLVSQALLASLSYGTVSVLISFANKAVMHSDAYSRPLPVLLTVVQLLFSQMLSVLLRAGGVLQFQLASGSLVRSMAPAGALLALMIVTGVAPMSSVNLGMWQTLRRMTTPIVLAMEVLVQGKRPARLETLSVGGMVVGCLIAGAGDLTFELYGYTVILLNCVITAAYLVAVNKVKHLRVSPVVMMYYTNLVALPIVALLLVPSGELSALREPGFWSASYQVVFWGSVVLAYVLNYTIFWCTTAASALMTSVTGQIKAVVVTVGGMVLFRDVVVTFANVGGIVVTTLASFAYAYHQYVTGVERERKLAVSDAAASSASAVGIVTLKDDGRPTFAAAASTAPGWAAPVPTPPSDVVAHDVDGGATASVSPSNLSSSSSGSRGGMHVHGRASTVRADADEYEPSAAAPAMLASPSLALARDLRATGRPPPRADGVLDTPVATDAADAAGAARFGAALRAHAAATGADHV